jgi:hypothetical protein
MSVVKLSRTRDMERVTYDRRRKTGPSPSRSPSRPAGPPAQAVTSLSSLRKLKITVNLDCYYHSIGGMSVCSKPYLPRSQFPLMLPGLDSESASNG